LLLRGQSKFSSNAAGMAEYKLHLKQHERITDPMFWNRNLETERDRELNKFSKFPKCFQLLSPGTSRFINACCQCDTN
jgi:hypothetical protein